MQAHGAEYAAALVPELMNYSGQHSAIQRCAMQHSVDYLREALQVWLAAGEKINYSVQDNGILTTIGFRLDAASWDDNREKFTPVQSLNYPRRRAELAAQLSFQQFQKVLLFSRKKAMHGEGAEFCMRLPTLNSPPAAALTYSEADHALAL